MNPEDVTPDTFPAYTPHPIIADFPPHLKDPDNYEKIQKALYDIGGSTCGHTEIIEWAGCKKCQRKQVARLQMMRKFGFKTAAHYMVWRRIHETIKRKAPLPKYNS